MRRGHQLIRCGREHEVVPALQVRKVPDRRSAEMEPHEIPRQELLPTETKPFKDFLLSMPDVGEDADFERVSDFGREVSL